MRDTPIRNLPRRLAMIAASGGTATVLTLLGAMPDMSFGSTAGAVSANRQWNITAVVPDPVPDPVPTTALRGDA